MVASVTSPLNLVADTANIVSKSLQADCPDFAVGGWNGTNASGSYAAEQSFFQWWSVNPADQPSSKLGCNGVHGTDKQKQVRLGMCFRTNPKIDFRFVSEHGCSKYKATFLVSCYKQGGISTV